VRGYPWVALATIGTHIDTQAANTVIIIIIIVVITLYSSSGLIAR
jgi:hypothetical protein